MWTPAPLLSGRVDGGGVKRVERNSIVLVLVRFGSRIGELGEDDVAASRTDIELYDSFGEEYVHDETLSSV
jgi:hypothetical protein